MVTKGLKEELVKRLDEAMQKEMDSENGVELGNGVVPNAVSQNNSDGDVEPEREDNTQSLSDDFDKTDKDVFMIDSNDGILNVNHRSEDQNGNAVKASGLAGTDEEAATTDELEDSAPGDQNVITQSVKRVEDVEHTDKYEDLNEDLVVVHSKQSNQVSEISQDLGLQVKYESISTDSVFINEKNNVKDNLNTDNFPLELEVVTQEGVQPSSRSNPSGGKNDCMVGDEQATGANCVTDEQDAFKRCVADEPEAGMKFVFDDQEAGKNFASDGQEVIQNLSLDKQEATNSNALNKEVVAQNHVSVQQPVTEEHGSLEVADTQNALIGDPSKKEDGTDVGSSEKLNLDRSSGDESMGEDLLESKHMEADFKYEEPAVKTEDNKVNVVLEQKPAVDAADIFSHEMKDIDVEYVKPTAHTEKRKLEETEAVGNYGAPKRQRRLSTNTLKVPQTSEQQTPHVSIPTTPKNTVHPALRPTFSRSNSTLNGESFKERIVSTPKKPATTSLRIDNFLRPFTLKAVQELLAKTGEVCDFWMDHIKTHCYVTYSSVEEATETRNAVHNLQWPQNGGRHLAADFVDPQEVKVRLEAPQSPETPRTLCQATPKPPPSQQIHATQQAWAQNLRQQPLPPPPPLAQPPAPTPMLSNQPFARERLPPPPPKKLEPPVLTLGDVFKKTRTTPWIYYLPLSEEKVAAKLAAQGKCTQLQ